MEKQYLHIVEKVASGSIAEELEIEAGDILLEINGNKIEDVFDYQYFTQDEYIEVLIRKRSGEEWLLEIDKEFDEDLGITFENGLMDAYRSFRNKCIFFFIDQMPKGILIGLSAIICRRLIFLFRRQILSCAARC